MERVTYRRQPLKITCRAYAELEKYASAFAEGKIQLLILVGRPGTAKSTHVRKAVGCEAEWIGGVSTPLGLYEMVYRAENRPVVIDDVDGFIQDRRAVAMLKNICQTDPERKVSWASTSTYLEKNELPREYVTSSPVCIIANEWDERDPNVKAVGDRGLIVEFDPSAAEVHKMVGAWCSDEEVYDFIGQHLHLSPKLSARSYVVVPQMTGATPCSTSGGLMMPIEQSHTSCVMMRSVRTLIA
jgi:hypothetical protein